jgi:DNA-binding MurR/RpiR family transcriptional regulator
MRIEQALQKQDSFSDSEKNLANYILQNPEEVLDLSVQALASKAFCSTSAVVRLCRKIGLEGFREFRIRLAAELQMDMQQEMQVNPDFPFTGKEGTAGIAKKMNAMMASSITQSYELAMHQTKAINQAVDLLLKARHIGLIAAGDSLLKGYVFQSNMMKIKKMVQISSVPGEDLLLPEALSEQDAALVISYSGSSDRVMESVQRLYRHNVPTIVLSANPKSPIALMASIVLELPKNEQTRYKLATFSSQAATEYMLNLLYSCIYVRNYEENSKIRQDTLELAKKADKQGE